MSVDLLNWSRMGFPLERKGAGSNTQPWESKEEEIGVLCRKASSPASGSLPETIPSSDWNSQKERWLRGMAYYRHLQPS